MSPEEQAQFDAMKASLEKATKEATDAKAAHAASVAENEQMSAGYTNLVNAFRPDADPSLRSRILPVFLADAGYSSEEIAATVSPTASESETPDPSPDDDEEPQNKRGGGQKDSNMNPHIQRLEAQLAEERQKREAAERISLQREGAQNRQALQQGIQKSISANTVVKRVRDTLGENLPKEFSNTLSREVESATVMALKERLRSSGQQVLDPAWIEEEAAKATASVAGKYASIVDAQAATQRVGKGSADTEDLDVLRQQPPAKLPDPKKVPLGGGEKAVGDYLEQGMLQDLAAIGDGEKNNLIG